MEGSSTIAVDLKKLKLEEETIPPREQRLDWFMTAFFKKKEQLLADDEKNYLYDPEDGTHCLTFRDFASFELDMYESGGFDVQDYSKVNDAGMIKTYYDPAAGINPTARYLPQITECAQQSILKYNADKGTHFDFKHVVKTNVEPVGPCRYYITFDAFDGTQGVEETFEAVVNVHIPTTKRTVQSVRVRQPPRYFLREHIADCVAGPPNAPRCVSCG